MEQRWKNHVSAAKSSKCYSPVFANAILKYGIDAFDHQVLEVVSTQEAADSAEACWIKQLNSRVPHGYNLSAGGGGRGIAHENTKKLLKESHNSRWQKMTPEECDEVKLRRSKSLRAWWQKMTPEERSAFLQKSWTPERRARAKLSWAEIRASVRRVESSTPRVRPPRKHSPRKRSAKNPAHSEQMSEWQTAQAKLRTPEQRQGMALKAWKTRRAKYGQDGVKRAKTSEEYSESSKRGWATMSSEARAERAQKAQNGRLKARKARISRLVRINFFRPSATP